MTTICITTPVSNVLVKTTQTEVVKIVTQGPQGPQGPKGDPGDAGGGTNLSVGTRTATTLIIASSTGTDATVPAATQALSGLMEAADKLKLDDIDSDIAALAIALS